jgi:hypothetical protein
MLSWEPLSSRVGPCDGVLPPDIKAAIRENGFRDRLIARRRDRGAGGMTLTSRRTKDALA